MIRSRGERAAAVVLFGALALGSIPACTQGRRADQADLLQSSISRTPGSVVAGTLSMALVPQLLPPSEVTKLQARPPGAATVAFTIDAASRRSEVRSAAGGPPVFLQDGRVLYARRTTQSKNDRRPWIRVELSRVGAVDKPSVTRLVESSGPGDAAVVTPQLMVDLLAGALTGSLEKKATSAGGVTTYAFNVSVDKANRALELDEDERDDREKQLRTLALTEDISAAAADVRSDGSLARFEVVFSVRPDKLTRLALTASLFADPPAALTSTAVTPTPERATTVRQSSINDIRSAVSDRLRPTAPAAPVAPFSTEAILSQIQGASP